MSYRSRQLLFAALAANAVRPARSRYGAIPAFFAGWMATELAPQWLAVTPVDAATELTVRRRRDGRRHPDKVGLALAAGTAATLGWVIVNAARSAPHGEATPQRDPGADYREELEEAPSAEELKTSLRDLAHPFKMARPGVEVIRDVNYTVGGKRARLDIYRPEGKDLEDAPVLV